VCLSSEYWVWSSIALRSNVFSNPASKHETTRGEWLRSRRGTRLVTRRSLE
jgi:hypothetical protein